MQANVITVSPDTPVEVAASLMAENKIGALPVVDPLTNTLVGIISQTDLFVMLARLLGGSAPGTRLELRLDDLPRQLAELGNIAADGHVRITNLVVAPTGQTQGLGLVNSPAARCAAGHCIGKSKRQGWRPAEGRPPT
jgi:acetoin utilization protein AcuB